MKKWVHLVKFGFLVAGSLSIVASTLVAKDFPPRGPMSFSSFDTDGNGCISEKEFSAVQNARMKDRPGPGMGRNYDDKMPKGNSMYQQSQRGMGQQGNMPSFESFDMNHDGKIGPHEMQKAREHRMEEKASEGKYMKNAGNQPSFSDIDANGDGEVSKKEFLEHQMQKRQQ